MQTRGPHHTTRRWLIGAIGTGSIVALAPSIALAQRTTNLSHQRARRSTDGDSWTSPDYGMEVTWEAPWTLGKTTGSADQGFEQIRLEPRGSIDYLLLTTSEISANFDSAKEYLDHYEESYDPDTLANGRDATDGVHLLLNQRTNDSLTVLVYYDHTTNGPTCELYEHHAGRGDDLAISAILVCAGNVFEGHIKGVQEYITFNGSTPYTTIMLPELVDAVNNAMDGDYGTSESSDPDSDADDDDDDDGSAGATSGLDDVRDHFDTLHESIAEFVELFGVERLSEAQANRINTIIGLWIDASDTAADAEIPSDFGDIEDAYLAYADNLTVAGNAFVTVLSDESSQAKKDRAASRFSEAMEAESELATTLDDLLTDAGV